MQDFCSRFHQAIYNNFEFNSSPWCELSLSFSNVFPSKLVANSGSNLTFTTQLSELKKTLSSVQNEVQEALQRASTALSNEQQARRDCQEQVSAAVAASHNASQGTAAA